MPATGTLSDPGLLAPGAQVVQSYSLCARFVLRQASLYPLLALPLACIAYRVRVGLAAHDGGRGLAVPASVLTALLCRCPIEFRWSATHGLSLGSKTPRPKGRLTCAGRR